MAQPIVVDDVWVSYRRLRSRRGVRNRRTDPIWALRGVSFDVARGEIVGVVGRNGSGKTTLLQVVAGVVAPTRGHVATAKPVASLVELAAGVQEELTAHENLLIVGVLLGMSRREVRRRYDAIVSFSGLTPETLDRPLRTFSAGMGLRLGFSLVVHSDPQVLLVDEVLAVGDDAFRHRCLARIEALRDNGCAVLVVSHDLAMIAERCTRALVLHEGRLRFGGDPADALEQYARISAVDAAVDDGHVEPAGRTRSRDRDAR